ncbi:MAG: anhydro-N-acetylmuramic acid kinase [Bdellovibrionales bacterium]|nr:anhydro-N-acetylmuramic acid kinase [Bdellovibrionales bacterium]
MIILGIMTGTSCDALDAVCVEFKKKKFKILSRFSKKYPTDLRSRIFRFQEPNTEHRSRDWIELNRDLGRFYSAAAQGIVRKASVQIDVIGNHGQTLAHFPGVGTLQFGDPSVISAETGLTVVSQFRTGDMAAGGQGAPLVPRFHQILAESSGASKHGCSIHNLGGFSNLTYIHPTLGVRAWDTGPGNAWIDLAVYRASRGKLVLDRGGTLARLGTPDSRSISKLLRHPFFAKKPPKSTGRDEFSAAQFFRNLKKLPLADAAATATLATAKSIANEYSQNILKKGLPLETIYFCGGGAQNKTLLECIHVELLSLGWFVEIKNCQELGVSAQDMEAAAFAFLAKESLLGHALGGQWTGANGFGPPGQITPGANWSRIFKKISDLQ